MRSANVHDAKTNLSKLLNAAAEGDEVIITRRGGKVNKFKLLPVLNSQKPKLFGALRGKIVFAPDYNKADEEVLKLFEERLNK
jgi:prevent-host-death family protein